MVADWFDRQDGLGESYSAARLEKRDETWCTLIETVAIDAGEM